MRKSISALGTAAIVLASSLIAGPAIAQVDCNQGLAPLDTAAGSRMGAMDFIHDVAAKEVAFARAFTGFAYTLDVTVQTLQDDKVDGEFHQVSNITYDATGARREAVTQGPTNTLVRVKLGNRDVESLRDAFSLTPDILADRDVVYAGRQELDNINTAAFDILARGAQARPQTFQGRVWVRLSEDAIIRSCGRVTTGPFGPMRYLVDRTQVGDQYYFPALIRADEHTPIDDKPVRVRVTVKYSNYKRR